MTKKRYQGPSNDKERSKLELINAVGTTIKTKGYTGLGATNIARSAGLDKRLIYLYFGSVENLIEIYVKGKDYYASAGLESEEEFKGENNCTKELLEKILTNQLKYFYQDEELQKIVLWQISQRSQIMFEVCEDREKFGTRFFKLADPEFENTGVDIRAVTGLLVAGIYHMVLHAKTTDSLFCEIDLNKPEGMERIKKAITDVLGYTYNRAAWEKKTKE